LLEALGDQERHKLIQALLRHGELGQTKLAAEAGVTTGSTSNAMQQLMYLDLVRRDSPKGPWRIRHRSEIFALLIAADALSGAIVTAGVREHEDTVQRRRRDQESD
jgi:DNA-binding IclR family transcriptional regulator